MRSNSNNEQAAINRDMQAAMMRTNDIYAAIGRKYFSENAENPASPEYAQMFNDLKTTLNQIDNMQTRLKFLNGIVVCTNCKAENSVNSSFCAVCGTRLPHTFAQDGALRCQRCGNPVKPGQKFCGVCGNVIEQGSPVQEAQGGQPSQGEFAPQGEIPQPFAGEMSSQEQPVFQGEPVQSENISQFGDYGNEVFQGNPIQSDVPVNEADSDVQNTSDVTLNSVPEEPDKQAEAGPAVCPQCKAVIKTPDALFCAECGYKLK